MNIHDARVADSRKVTSNKYGGHPFIKRRRVNDKGERTITIELERDVIDELFKIKDVVLKIA